jgi:putative membrane protein
MMWDGNGSFGHGAGWEGWMMLLFMIVFVIAVIVAIVFLVKYFSQSPGTPAATNTAAPTPAGTPESPKDILRRRYAAGEIEREEYLQKLGDL